MAQSCDALQKQVLIEIKSFESWGSSVERLPELQRRKLCFGLK